MHCQEPYLELCMSQEAEHFPDKKQVVLHKQHVIIYESIADGE
jgi:hypothetical protein